MVFTEEDIEDILGECEEENFVNKRADDRRNLEADLERKWEIVTDQRKELKIKKYQMVIDRLQELLQQEPLPDLSEALSDAEKHANDSTNEDEELIRTMEYDCYYIEDILDRQAAETGIF